MQTSGPPYSELLEALSSAGTASEFQELPHQASVSPTGRQYGQQEWV